MSKIVLVAEDEPSLSAILRLNLEFEGFKVLLAESGLAAIELFRANRELISLALLDVMMPGADGFEVCRIIKAENERIPVIFLTAKGESEDRIKGLKTGADDYLVKPFNLEELLLRVNIVMKRMQSEQQVKEVGEFEFGGGKIDFNKFEILDKDGIRQELTKREILLLKLLTGRRNEVVSRDEILEKLWEPHENPSSRTIDNMILLFRKYFEQNPKEPVHFHSIRGVGYKFVA